MAEIDRRWLILENIKETFALILAEDGYNADIKHYGIGYKHFTEIKADKFPALMVIGADEDRENGTNKTFTSEMRVSIAGYVRSSEVGNPEIAERDLSRLISDLTKALLVDHTRGGHSRVTEIGPVTTDKGYIQPFAGFQMVVSVEYRSDFVQP